MLQLKRYLSVFALLLLVGCGNSDKPNIGIGGGGSTTFDSQEKSYLYNLFLTEYYWSASTPQPFDTTPYTTPQPMIDVLKNATVDRWSVALTRQQYDDFATQKTAGFGFGYADGFVIYLTNINSPADKSGLRRGDKITSVNGQPVTDELIAQASDNLNVSTHFGIDRDGTPIELDITAQEYSYNVSSYSLVTTTKGSRVGYFRFDSFSDTSTDEIESAFNYFAGQSVDKLVIDLRYNGGGSVNTASILLDKIGRLYNGQMQFKLAWNDQNSDKDETLFFDSLDANSLTLNKLIFLTTEGSASASELVINAMKPYMNGSVAVVGTTTHGKPVGMAGRTNGSYIYFLINFVVENSVGFYDYFNGIAPECSVPDNDYTHQLGDPNEALLKKALYYIDNNHC